MNTELLWMCVSSFTGVFSVLVFLAITMHIITLVFPEKEISKSAGSDDAVFYATISSTYARLYPGMKVTNIEEIKK